MGILILKLGVIDFHFPIVESCVGLYEYDFVYTCVLYRALYMTFLLHSPFLPFPLSLQLRMAFLFHLFSALSILEGVPNLLLRIVQVLVKCGSSSFSILIILPNHVSLISFSLHIFLFFSFLNVLLILRFLKCRAVTEATHPPQQYHQ